jgi:hypothetical protein
MSSLHTITHYEVVRGEVFGFIKKTTSYGTEKMYSLHIFPPELHTLMASLY